MNNILILFISLLTSIKYTISFDSEFKDFDRWNSLNFVLFYIFTLLLNTIWIIDVIYISYILCISLLKYQCTEYKWELENETLNFNKILSILYSTMEKTFICLKCLILIVLNKVYRYFSELFISDQDSSFSIAKYLYHISINLHVQN